jgi:Ca2+-binding RTX toxin-like protein
MTDNVQNQASENGNQPVGSVVILYGSVRAVATDGAERVLAPGSPVFLGDHIVTGPDGMVSIFFEENGSQLDLGRMSEAFIDQEVAGGSAAEAAAEIAAEVADIQEALEQGDIEQILDLPAPAAGAGVAGGHGSLDYVVFEADNDAVLPEFGEETTGIGYDFLDPRGGGLPDEPPPPPEPVIEVAEFEPEPPPPEPPEDIPPPPPPPPEPSASFGSGVVDERALDGTDDVAPGDDIGTIPLSDGETVSGTFVINTNGEPYTLVVGGVTISAPNTAVVGTYGTLLVSPDGSWTYTLTDNTLMHPDNIFTDGDGDRGADDIVQGEAFSASVTVAGFPPITGTLTIDILDDGPVINDFYQDEYQGDYEGERPAAYLWVQEDALNNDTLNTWSPNNPDIDNTTGNLDSEYDTDQDTTNLSWLVNFGADGPGTNTDGEGDGYEPWSLAVPDGFDLETYDTGLTSNTVPVVYSISGNTLTAKAGDIVIFTFSIAPDGTATFDLDGQLDHTLGTPGTDYDILTISDLGQFVKATDADGDSVTLDGLVNVTVQNDVPAVVPEGATLNVHEDALGRDGTDGLTSPDNNDDADYPNQGNIDDVDRDTDSASVNLDSLVSTGADEPVTFGLSIGDNDYVDSGLTSRGDNVYIVEEGGILVGVTYENNTAGGTVDRTVFEISLETDYTDPDSPLTNLVFDLDDQIDHTDAPDDIPADDKEIESLALGQYVTVTDADGDSTTLTYFNGETTVDLINVNIENDVPAVAPEGATLYVHEDALGRDGTDGLTSPANNDDADYPNQGNIDDVDRDTDSASVNLDSLVSTGADEPVTFGLSIGDNDYVDSGLTSKGDNVYIIETDDGLQGVTYENNTPGGTVARTIFEISLETDTTTDPDNPLTNLVFDLDDQIDHTDAPDDIPADDKEIESLALGQYVTVTDADGDSTTLTYFNGETLVDLININIENDVPVEEATADIYFVSEYAGYNNFVGTYFMTDGSPDNPQVLVASSNDAAGGNMGENEQLLGTYEEGAKIFIIANAANQIDPGAEFQFIPNPGDGPDYILQVRNPGEDWVNADDLVGDAGVYFMDTELNADGLDHFKDENGNIIHEVPDEGGEIRIEDLSLGDADYDDVVLRVEKGATVSEANLDDGTSPDAAALTVSGNLFTDTTPGSTGDGMIRIGTGADEPGTLTITPTAIDVNGEGASGTPVTITLDNDGDFITVMSEAGELTIHDNGDWSYTLVDNTLVHPDNDPGGADHTDGDSDRGTGDQVQDIFNLSYTDFDGDTVNPLLIININDDGPEIGDPQDAILANEADNSLIGDLDITFGADGPGELILNPVYNGVQVEEGQQVIDNFGNPLTVNGENLYWVQNDDGSWSGVTKGSITVAVADGRDYDSPLPVVAFTVSLQEDVNGYTGNYEVVLHEELDHTAEESMTIDFKHMKGGRAEQLVIENAGFVTTFTGNNPTPDGGWDDVVNWSGQGIGVGNNFVNEDDIIVKGPGEELQSEELYINFTDSDGNPISVKSVSMTVDHLDKNQQGNNTPPEKLFWETRDEFDQLVDSGELVGEGEGSTWKNDQILTIDTGNSFSKIILTSETANSEGYRVENLEITFEEEMPLDHTLTFVVDGTDGDGDSFEQADFNVTFDGEGDIIGTSANEVIAGSTGDDTIDGMGGDDVIYGGAGDDTIDGGEGDDTIYGDGVDYDDSGTVEADESGDDTISGGAGNDTLVGGAGEDDISGDAGDDVIFGGDDNDTLDGGADNDTISGGDGDDVIVGGTGDDDLFGGDETGADGAGTDTITGDEAGDDSDTGSDNFADTGGDTVTDYDAGEDTMDDLVPPTEPDPTV